MVSRNELLFLRNSCLLESSNDGWVFIGLSWIGVLRVSVRLLDCVLLGDASGRSLASRLDAVSLSVDLVLLDSTHLENSRVMAAILVSINDIRSLIGVSF